MGDNDKGEKKGLLDKILNSIDSAFAITDNGKKQAAERIKNEIQNAQTLDGLEYHYTHYKSWIEDYPELKEVYDKRKEELEKIEPQNPMGADFSDTVEDIMTKVFKNPMVSEIAETIGATVRGMFITPLETAEVKDPDWTWATDPEAAAARNGIQKYLGTSIALTAIPSAINVLAETVSLGQIDQVGKSMNEIYFATGLNWMTWTMLSETIRQNLNEPMKRFYNRRYRPTRFNFRQLQDLYSLGLRSEEDVKTELKFLGWRDEDIDVILKLSDKQPSLSMLLDFYEKGIMDDETLKEKVGKLGYSDDDVSLIIQTYAEKKVEENKKLYLSQLQSAFKKGIMDVIVFKQYLKELGYGDDEIDIIVQLNTIEQENKVRDITKSQLDKAYKESIIDETQYRKEMLELGYTEEAIKIQINIMDTELKPKFKSINVGTLKTAYKKGAISRGTFEQKMVDIGYRKEDVDIIIKSLKEKGEKVEKKPSLSALMSATRKGIILPTEMKSKLTELGYSSETADMYVRIATEQVEKKSKGLSKAEIIKAFKMGMLSVEDATTELINMGYNADDAELLLVMAISE